LLGKPAASSTLFLPAGTGCCDVSHCGVWAATSHWWLRNDPPNALWKKLSAMT
jgi:hypothetical protein